MNEDENELVLVNRKSTCRAEMNEKVITKINTF